MTLKSYVRSALRSASAVLPYLASVPLTIEVPKNESQGDLSTNVALVLSKAVKRNPREVAAEIVSHLNVAPSVIHKVDIAGPGFINFYFTPAFVASIICEVLEKRESFGRSDIYAGKRANIEFVSANPTGPLTVGHGRNAVCGDTIAAMLEWVGYTVDREYYFNNAGRQMRVLGDSVKLRYLSLLGDVISFPDDYYQGEYITLIAEGLKNEFGSTLRDESPEGIFKQRAEAVIFEDIKGSLGKIGIVHSLFYNEHSLYESGRIQRIIDRFKEKSLCYEQEGALWLKLSELGNDQDKVIVKSSGEPTYRLPDIAYHETKYERGYDLIVDLFGSDHAATYPDVLAGLRALGYDTDKVKVFIHQFVTIIKDGQAVKMSTRKANYITLDELVDEVGADVVRYFFSMRSIGTHMNFDLDLAKKQSDENPVFYLQYGHARICSIMRMAEQEKLLPAFDALHVLTVPEEQRLLKHIAHFEEEMLLAAESGEASKVTSYLEELAGLFHRFYTVCRVIGSPQDVAQARLALIEAVRIVLKNGLTLLGVSAPERM